MSDRFRNKIIILADSLDNQYAGIHYFTKHLVKGINKLNYSILKTRADKNINKERQLIVKHPFRLTGYQLLRIFLLIPVKIIKHNPDIVIEPAHFGPFNLPSKIKRVTVIHDLTPIMFPKYHRLVGQIMQKIFLPGILKRADLIITNSKCTTDDIIKHYSVSEKKIKAIYLGKEELFKPTINISVLHKYEIKDSYFLNVGTIEPRKNLITLLKAFKLFKEQSKSNVQLIITGGKGWKSKSFYRMLRNHPFKSEIKLLGYVEREDLPVLYTSALAFIYPSYYEGFGLPVLEAMACGAPCIISNTSSLPEVGGDAVLYFNPKKADELSEKMLLISNNKTIRNSLSELALSQASKFSWEKYAQEFIAELETRFAADVNSKQART